MANGVGESVYLLCMCEREIAKTKIRNIHTQNATRVSLTFAHANERVSSYNVYEFIRITNQSLLFVGALLCRLQIAFIFFFFIRNFNKIGKQFISLLLIICIYRHFYSSSLSSDTDLRNIVDQWKSSGLPEENKGDLD